MQKVQTLKRFFDAKFEYLQQARGRSLEKWKMESPWVGIGSMMECLAETHDNYKSKKGNHQYRQELEKRNKVRFAVLIRSPLETKRMIAPSVAAAAPPKTKPTVNHSQPGRAAPPAPPRQHPCIRRAHERAARAKN